MNLKNNTKTLNLEEKILNELQENCRVNLDVIGKKCGCSRYKVGKIIRKLEKEKIIIGYRAIVDPKKLKLNYYILLVKRTPSPLTETIKKNLSRGKFTDILPEIDIKIIDTLYINGYYDFLVSFMADDISKAKELCNRILQAYNPYIEKVELLGMIMPFRFNGVRVLQPEIKSNIL